MSSISREPSMGAVTDHVEALHAAYVSVAEITIDAPASIVWPHVLNMGSWICDIHFEHASGEIGEEGESKYLWPVGADDASGPVTIAAKDRTPQNAMVLKILKLIPGKLWYGVNPPQLHDGVRSTGVNVIWLTENRGATIVTAIRSMESMSPNKDTWELEQKKMAVRQAPPQRRWMESYLPRLKELAETTCRCK